MSLQPFNSRGNNVKFKSTMHDQQKLPKHWSDSVHRIFACCAALVAAVVGCSPQQRHALFHANDVAYYSTLAQEAFYENPQLADLPPLQPEPAPRTLLNNDEPEYWNLTLDEAIQYALFNSTVLRELGGTILTSPDSLQTTYAVALQETDPQFGPEAALSAFDAQFAASAYFEKGDRALNNQFFGGGTRILKQDLDTFQSEISKIAATGTEMYVRNFTDYDDNNAPGNQFGTVWNSNFEMEFRHPLLQGGGTKFNRIAGPNSSAGSINGLLIARTNRDISQTDFELGVRNFVNNVANSYWDLYFSYRDLDAKIFAREKSLEAWRRVNALKENKQRGGEEDREALAQEQYFRFEEEVQNSLTGRPGQGTQAGGTSTGGTFRGSSGVHSAERRLRLMMGVPITDNRLIRPSDEPEMVKVFFDWDSLVMEAVSRRSELARQRLRVRQREMELVANRNFLMPRLDFVALQRWRGLGRDLLKKNAHEGQQFSSAWQTLASGNFQEWQLGMELTIPIGYRSAHAAVQNSELQLARERALLHEQERRIVYDLSNTIAELDRTYAVAQTNLNRYRASRRLLDSLENLQDQGFTVDLDRLLDAQRRVADAESRYFLSQVEYVIALKNVNLEKGGLLEYYGLVVSEDKEAQAQAEISDDEMMAVKEFSNENRRDQVGLTKVAEAGENSKPMNESPATGILPVGLADSFPEPPANRVMRLDEVDDERANASGPIELDRTIPETAPSEATPNRVLRLDDASNEQAQINEPVELRRRIPEAVPETSSKRELTPSVEVQEKESFDKPVVLDQKIPVPPLNETSVPGTQRRSLGEVLKQMKPEPEVVGPGPGRIPIPVE